MTRRRFAFFSVMLDKLKGGFLVSLSISLGAGKWYNNIQESGIIIFKISPDVDDREKG